MKQTCIFWKLQFGNARSHPAAQNHSFFNWKWSVLTRMHIFNWYFWFFGFDNSIMHIFKLYFKVLRFFRTLPWKLIKLLNLDFPENANLLHFPYEFQWFQRKYDSKSKGPPFDHFTISMISTFQIGISRKCKFASFPWWISIIAMKYVVKFKGSPLWLFSKISHSARIHLELHG